MLNFREVGGDLFIAVYDYIRGVTGVSQSPTPVIEVVTGGRYCLKVN